MGEPAASNGIDTMGVCLKLTKQNRELQANLKRTSSDLKAVRDRMLKSLNVDASKKDDFSNVNLVTLVDMLVSATPSPQVALAANKSGIAHRKNSGSDEAPAKAHSASSSILPSVRVRGPMLDNKQPVSMRNVKSALLRDQKEMAKEHFANEAAKKDKKNASDSVQKRFESTQRRCWKLENDVAKRNSQISHWKKKCDEMATHTERLMFHLKQETAAKATAQHRAADYERRLNNAKKKIREVTAEREETKKMMVILKQGAEILEGQLRSLDVRFMQLRGTLDWHTHHARDEMQAASREFVRLSSEIELYREKWNKAEGKIHQIEFEAQKARASHELHRKKSQEKIKKLQQMKSSSLENQTNNLTDDGIGKGGDEPTHAVVQESHKDLKTAGEGNRDVTEHVERTLADRYKWNYESVTLPDPAQKLPDWEVSFNED